MTGTRLSNSRSTVIFTGISIFLVGLFVTRVTRSSLSPLSSAQNNNHDLYYDHIHNRTLGFQKVYAVSLKERTDHRDALTLQSAVTGFDIDFIDGVHPDSVPKKALPFVTVDTHPTGAIGAWRGHMNALAEVVHKGITTALIFEDDVDWDIRIKDVLSNVGAMIRIAEASRPKSTVLYDNVSPSSIPGDSAYGSGWDVLWLGHCGMHIPENSTRVLLYDDMSVPQPRYLSSWDGLEDALGIYPNHSRAVITPLTAGVCSLGYAVSAQGARKMLYDMGLQRFDMALDLMLGRFCQQPENVCLGVLPQIFEHHRPRGNSATDSDISDLTDGYNRDSGFTQNIRWSVRLNLQELLTGGTNWVDQYPDV